MSDTFIYIIVGIVILHFVAGIGYLIYKISGGNSSKKDKVKNDEGE
ncbi:hypothetical protein [Algoriphagus sp. Y33]|nr:hypothetical protein [Algoriphagus sp. Y33]